MQLTQRQIDEFTKRARVAGMNDSQIQQEISKKVAEFDQNNGLSQLPIRNKPSVSSTPTESFSSKFVSSLTDTTDQPDRSVEGFAGNVGKSLVRNVGDMIKSAINVLNPNMDENTIANIGKLGIDAVKLAAGDSNEANRAKLVVDFYKKRYGEDLSNTLYEDPVGVLLDISTVMGGASTVLKGASAVSKSSTLAKVAGTLEKVSAATDPVAQAGKLAVNGLKYTKVADKVAEATQGIRESIANEAASRSLRANPTQMENFQKLIGSADQPGDIGAWMNENGIRTKEDVVKQIKIEQKAYNDLVRTDTPISGQLFAEKLKARADQIEKADVSPSARALAEKLRAEAEVVAKKENVTDTIITNSKTSQFSKVGKKAMIDPITDNFNKEYSSVALQMLDEIAPGSAEVGKKLQVLREFDGIVSKQRNLGKGAQIINIFKPAMAGLTSGYILSGGKLAGAIGFSAAASLMTNPFILQSSAKILTEGIKMSDQAVSGLKTVGDMAYSTTKTGRLNLEAEKLKSKTNPGGTLQKGDSSSPSTIQAESQGLTASGVGSYNSVAQQRKDAVLGLSSMGVTDPQAQLELLNYDENGKKIGDFTLSEIVGYHNDNEKKAAQTSSLNPSVMNPFGGLSKRQVLALALSQGASKKDLDEVGQLYDTFAGDPEAISQDNMKIIDNLSSDYFQRTKENGFLEVSQAFQKVSNTSETAAGDLSLIYGYMKLLDPSSVVRETEQSMAQNAGSFGDKVQNAVSQIMNGKRLTTEQRDGFRNEAEKVFDTYRTKQAKIDAFYQGKARKYGVDPSLIGVGLYQ